MPSFIAAVIPYYRNLRQQGRADFFLFALSEYNVVVLIKIHNDLIAFLEYALKDLKGKRILDVARYGPLERTRTEVGS